ncbi:MAG: pilus assembly protein N-terminal domain-containing protein [Candidatus Omnitrophota bacterium]
MVTISRLITKTKGLKILFFIICAWAVLSASWVPCAFAYSQIAEYLCEIGIKFFQQGRYEEALHEFKKALLAKPDYEAAQKYIEMTERMIPGAAVMPTQKIPSATPAEYMELLEIQKEMMREKQRPVVPAMPAAQRPAKAVSLPGEIKKRIYAPRELTLDESFSRIRQPIEIEQGETIAIKGRGIQRFLVTEPLVLKVERKGLDEILVTGERIGYTFLHIWDQNGRWTLEFLTIPPRPQGPTLEEELRQAEEKAKNFKFRYYLDWSSFETGRKWDSLKRSSYSWRHSLTFFGETPYGMFDSTVSGNVWQDTSEVSYMSVGLTQGRLGTFKDFNVRLLDFTPALSNLILWGGNLRGAMLNSPAFDNMIDYTVFWGTERGGLYGDFTPGFTTERESYLTGIDVNIKPKEKQKYGFSIVRGGGSDRLPELNEYGYDADFSLDFAKGSLSGDVGFDSKKFAYLLNASTSIPDLIVNSEFRNIDKEFLTMTGLGSRAGELGLLTNIFYTPREYLTVNARTDFYQDRLFPRPTDEDAWNQDMNLGVSLQADPATVWRVDYALQNDLGKVSPLRNYNAGLSLNRYFDWIRRINTFIMYRYYHTNNFRSPTLDYINNRIMMGISFNIIKDLNYFVNQEFGWIEALKADEKSHPRALQTGLDWGRQIFKSPFFVNLRFFYRDEENTLSPFSFLSGEDYVESYGEISYKPTPDLEAFFNTRVRNVWAENPTTQKRLDVNFYSGLRYLWDTGLRWESVGAIDGYVFKDYNSDGLRQRDEPPVEGVKIWMGKDKFEVTDLFGYYRFRKIKAAKAFVNIDTTTIPPGFLLTVPSTQEAPILQAASTQINFGILSKTEIVGIVFDDVDGKKELGPGSVGLKGVEVYLEDGSRAKTDNFGRYAFKKANLGKHRLTLDLKTVPAQYIPTVPIFVDFELSEGDSFSYNIPMKKTE